jgi:hypothetical protein
MKNLTQILLLFVFLVFGANIVQACSCSQISHSKEFREANLIFAGRVISIVPDTSFTPPKLKVSASVQKILDSQKRYFLKFEVVQQFKGVQQKEVVLEILQSDSPCSGIMYSEGEKYLIYGYRSKNVITDGGLCSRTRTLDVTSEEYKEIKSFWFRLRSRLWLL